MELKFRNDLLSAFTGVGVGRFIKLKRSWGFQLWRIQTPLGSFQDVGQESTRQSRPLRLSSRLSCPEQVRLYADAQPLKELPEVGFSIGGMMTVQLACITGNCQLVCALSI